MRKWLRIAAALLIAASASGCGSMVSVNADKDEQQIVATVNGTDIPKAQYYAVFDSIAPMYGMTAEDFNSADNGAVMRETLLEQLVDDELLYQQAVEDGLVDTSEAHMEEVRNEIQEQLEEQREQYKEQYDTDAEAQEAYEAYLERSGYDDIDARVQDTIRQTALTDEYNKIIETVTVTEDDAKEYFDEQVEIQKEAIDADPSSYSLYTSQGGNYYNPEGSVYVRNLLIGLPDEVQSQISELRSAGDTAAADALRDEELAKIKAQADAALARANSGEDFSALIEELGSDPGMEQEPAKTYGYMVYEGSNFVDAFEDASLALQNDGQISPLVPTDFGYHIIERVSDAAGPVPFDSVRESIIESQTSSKQSKAYQQFLEELKDGADVVLYSDRLEIFNR